VQVRTGEQSAQEAAQEVNDQIAGFLVPALLSFAGAAVLVGAFIIFNTFSITVAQRAREFALLRCLGASRAQVLRTVALEALAVGALASVAGILTGVGFAVAVSAVFDAAGASIPRGELTLAPRTILVSLAVGLGITLLAALAPALRATRVPPVTALSDLPLPVTRRRRRWTTVLSVAVLACGVTGVAAGAFGSGPAVARLSTMGGGAVLVFVGVALNARHLVRPLASGIGWPLQRSFGTTGRLARENAMRNPARTAITSAALMVGLALVVFVSVFAASLKDSISAQIDELIRGDLFVYPENFQPLPAGVVDATGDVPGVATATGIAFDQIEVDGRPSNPIYDIALGVDPAALGRVYRFEWVEGSDALLARLSGDAALVEEQFARARRVGVGDTYRVRTTSGGRTRFRVIGIYRDPTILQGTMVDARALARVSATRDPTFVLADVAGGADAEEVQRQVRDALSGFPLATIQSRTEYKETIEDRLGQLVTLIYALLGVSLVIALFGIANSLFLTIHERIREFGLLRAIGASRAQLRRIVRYESVITAVIGGLLGIGIGVLFASLVIGSLGDFGLALSLPAVQLVVFAALAVAAGVIGAALPARRGSRVDVLVTLHHD
jgi:putative ABC transport system permease protein